MSRFIIKALWNDTDVDRLRHELLKDYDINARPENNGDVTNCTVELSLINLEMDEERGVMLSHIWIHLNWTDNKLKWDNDKYPGIKSVHVAADEVWQPDLMVYNSAEVRLVEHFAKTNKIVYSHGSVLWVPPGKFETYCNLNLKFWPFDVQKCDIKIGSWTYNGYQLDLKLLKDHVNTAHYTTNQEWEVLDSTAVRNSKIYPCCAEPYIDTTFTLVLKRKSPMFKSLVIIPALAVACMMLVTFWLPPQSTEKLLLNGIAAVLTCMMLLYFSKLFTVLSSSPPLIVMFYFHSLLMLCISLIISVIVVNMSRNPKNYAVPLSLRKNISDGILGKIFGPKKALAEESETQISELKETPFEEQRNSSDHKVIDLPPNPEQKDTQNDWTRVAIIIDHEHQNLVTIEHQTRALGIFRSHEIFDSAINRAFMFSGMLVRKNSIELYFYTSTATDVDKLKHDLLKNYDPTVRPENFKDTTLVTVGLTLQDVEIDESRGAMISHVWGNFDWNDSKLIWDKELYNNVTSLIVPIEQIWHPDIYVYNSMNSDLRNQFYQTHKVVTNGSVLWVPPAKLESYCNLNLKFWPFDTHTCKIKMGSWTSSGYHIDLKAKDSTVDTSDFNGVFGWDVLKTKVTRNEIFYSCCPEPYVDISMIVEFYKVKNINKSYFAAFTITLQRRSPIFKSVVIIPALAVICMMMVSFWLPPQSTEKLLLNGIAAVLTCIMLLYFSKLFNALSSSPPIIVMFYSCTLLMLCFSLIISVIVVNISRNPKRSAVPYTVKSILLDGFIAKAFGVFDSNQMKTENNLGEIKQNSLDKIQEDHKVMELVTETKNDDIQNDWIRLAIVVDRAVFLAYVLIFIGVIFLHFI
ncbi:CLUMA_CG000057, isoform A [Clunio marinus]|uniref:CLUMA_CG000057, isoform A n=1 Tax=Clunio marinus TaxID=568069 RepID=A0A1J1HEH5_9DIPT|nr:CLUMA_CG000057, isoform A [Clunio marinus]